jgi:hypothetical protein
MGEEKNLPATNNGALTAPSSMFFDVARFEAMWKIAGALAKSDMLPKQFINNTANCIIALNLADRLRVDPFMMMQSMYVVHGRPGIEGKLAIALVDGTGRFAPLKFRMEGEGKTEKGVKRPNSCTAYATEIKTGEVVEGPPVTWEMAVAEGWTKPKGDTYSKWQTLPDLMFRYRAAMFFARVNCPGALLGLRSVDELEDIGAVNLYETSPGKFSAPQTTGPEPTDDTAVKAFDEATKDWPASLPAYLDVCAKYFKTSIEGVKAGAANDLEKFKANFDKWERKHKKTEEKAPPPVEEVSPYPCPKELADETKFTKKHCEACADRDGCPAW